MEDAEDAEDDEEVCVGLGRGLLLPATVRELLPLGELLLPPPPPLLPPPPPPLARIHFSIRVAIVGMRARSGVEKC